ncbi:MAG: hypothetical protein HZC40_00105 [Chloroflexi bacterium]|nr:hypothetical protein [Chloroflexota bacterium]
MTPDIFAEWLSRQKYTVIRTASSYWYNQVPRVYQAFPYHWIIQPSDCELSNFLRENKSVGLRYSTSLDAIEGAVSYHAVYENSVYGFENLGKWARKNVRRGLKNCNVQPISFETLAEEGWALQLDTLDRQGRRLELAKEIWRKRCLAACDLPGFEAWGALVAGRLAASVITFQMEDCCYMLYQQCHRDYLPVHVNNALSFVVTQTMINRPQIHSIFYGLHSLDAPSSVDEFKFRMGYTAKPVRQRVVFHPYLAPLFNRVSHAAVRGLLHWQPGHPTLAKAEGMMRFYLQGKLPLDKQELPSVLRSADNDLLERD